MGIPDGAHTHGHGSGGSGLGRLVLVILAAALLGPAVAGLLHVLVIAAAVILGLAAVAVVALGAWRLRRQRPEPPPAVYRITATAKPPEALPETRRAIGPAREVHLH